MPLLIRADLYACSDPYTYNKPEHVFVRAFQTEEALADLIKYVKKEYKKHSYWYITITRFNMDVEEWVTTETVSNKNPLKQRIQLNANAKPESPRTRIPKAYSATMPTPSASLAEMVAHMEAIQATQAPPVEQWVSITGTQPSTVTTNINGINFT